MSQPIIRRFVAYLTAEESDCLHHLRTLLQPSHGRVSLSDAIRAAIVEAHASRTLPSTGTPQ